MRFIIFIVFFTFITSCNNDKIENQNIDTTPETLTNDNNIDSYSSLSKGYKGNIMDRLYTEALEKDKNLNRLNKEIYSINSDSLSEKTNEYLKFKRTNNDYWSTVTNYAVNINDSITKKATIEIINKLKNDYEKTISLHDKKMLKIDSLQSKLIDQEIIMKIFVTQSMIEKYQKNEMPDIKKLESLINDYNELIKETEEYTLFNK